MTSKDLKGEVYIYAKKGERKKNTTVEGVIQCFRTISLVNTQSADKLKKVFHDRPW